MAIKTQIAKIASKEMDRRDFLKYSGVVLLSAFGITSLLRVMTMVGGEPRAGHRANTYGTAKFGR